MSKRKKPSKPGVSGNPALRAQGSKRRPQKQTKTVKRATTTTKPNKESQERKAFWLPLFVMILLACFFSTGAFFLLNDNTFAKAPAQLYAIAGIIGFGATSFSLFAFDIFINKRNVKVGFQKIVVIILALVVATSIAGLSALSQNTPDDNNSSYSSDNNG